MNGHGLLLALGRHGNADRAAGGINAIHQPSEAALLPLFTFAGLFFRDVRLFHDDNGIGYDGFSVVGRLAAHKNAIAGLDVGQLDGRGVFQVLLAGRNSNEFGGVPNLNGHVASGIRGQ